MPPGRDPVKRIRGIPGTLLVLACTVADPPPAGEVAARFVAAEDFAATGTVTTGSVPPHV